MKQNLINKVAIVLDASGSMASLVNDVNTVFSEQVKFLAKRSQELDQETRISAYMFNGGTENLVYDKDVLRIPSIKDVYAASGSTNLIEATLKVISDIEKVPHLYGDVAHLIYVITDGQNTDNSHLASKLKQKIESLPDNVTLAILVPSQMALKEAVSFGFPRENIQIWSTTKEGLKDVSTLIENTTGAYMMARSSGVRGTKNLFALSTQNLNTKAVANTLTELKPSEYDILPVHTKQQIKPFVESWTGKEYRVGSAFYELMKTETIQAYKQVCIQIRKNGKVYSGIQARKLIGLPDADTKVTPTDANYSEYKIFVASSSINRNLIPGTQLLVLK